jgi:hypothetical protein
MELGECHVPTRSHRHSHEIQISVLLNRGEIAILNKIASIRFDNAPLCCQTLLKCDNSLKMAKFGPEPSDYESHIKAGRIYDRR